jgi:hypothetical protein
MADSPFLGRLRALDLSFTELTAGDLIRLCRSPHLRLLRHLSLAGNPLGASFFPILAENLDQGLHLDSLDLGGLDFGGEAAVLLTRHPALQGLSTLILWGDGESPYSQVIRAGGAAALARWERNGGPTRLVLNYQHIGDAGLAALADSPVMAPLRHLCLAHNGIGTIGTSGIDALSSSARLCHLITLDLKENPLGVAGGRALAGWAGLETVRELDLSECQLGDGGVAALAASPHLRGLRTLRLNGNRLTDRAAPALLESPTLPGTLKLELSRNGIDPSRRDALAHRYRIDFD